MIGVLASGSGTNLQALIDAEIPILAVASNRTEARALERARGVGIPNRAFELDGFADRELRDLAMAEWLQGHGVHLVVCAGYMHVLTPGFLGRFPGRVVNVHPSLLPAFPGLRAIERALEAGVTETGVTVHLVDEGVDTGFAIAQEAVPILPGDTLEALEERVHEVEHRLLPAVVRGLLVSL